MGLIGTDIDIVLRFLLADHFDLLHLNLLPNLLLPLRIIHLLTTFLLGLGRLLIRSFLHFGGMFSQFQSRQQFLFFLRRLDFKLDMMIGSPPIDQQVGTLAVLSLIPIVVIIIGEGPTVAFGVYVGWVEGIDDGVVELEPFALLVLDVADVVAHFGIADVADDAS